MYEDFIERMIENKPELAGVDLVEIQ